MNIKNLFCLFLILVFGFSLGQNQNYKLAFHDTFLPSLKKMKGKIDLTSQETEYLDQLMKDDSLVIRISGNDAFLFKKMYYMSSLKCDQLLEDIVKSNTFIVPYNEIKADDGKNLNVINEDSAKNKGLPFGLGLEKNKKPELLYEGDLLATPNYKNLRNYFIFYMLINNLQNQDLKPYKQYFNKPNLYKLLLNYLGNYKCSASK